MLTATQNLVGRALNRSRGQPKGLGFAMFDSMHWQPDRMTCKDVLYRLQHFKSHDWGGGDQHFLFYKTRDLIKGLLKNNLNIFVSAWRTSR